MGHQINSPHVAVVPQEASWGPGWPQGPRGLWAGGGSGGLWVQAVQQTQSQAWTTTTQLGYVYLQLLSAGAGETEGWGTGDSGILAAQPLTELQGMGVHVAGVLGADFEVGGHRGPHS